MTKWLSNEFLLIEDVVYEKEKKITREENSIVPQRNIWRWIVSINIMYKYAIEAVDIKYLNIKVKVEESPWLIVAVAYPHIAMTTKTNWDRLNLK
jgi:hypothetical protein